jgi:hypothetical protein
MIKRLGKQPEDFFLTRKMTRQKFAKIQEWARSSPFRHAGISGISGRQTRADLHRVGDPDLQHQGLESAVLPDDGWPLRRLPGNAPKVQWDKYGVVDGVARDPRCENCMVHCGYDPSGALGTNYQRGDNWKNFKYNSGAKPKPLPSQRRTDKARLQRRVHRQGPSRGSKAAINSPRAAMNGAQSVFQRREEPIAAKRWFAER